MKRIKLISLLLCAALVLTFAGCAADPVGTEPTTQSTTQAAITETTEETTVPSYTDPSVTYHAPMFAISMPAVTETSKASDGETLFEYTYQTMTLSLPEAMVADEIYLDLLNRQDAFHNSAEDLLSAAAAAYTGQEEWQPHSLSVAYQPKRFDEMVLSFLVKESIFDGYTRSNSTQTSVTYDLLTGNALDIRDILVADYSADELVDLIVAGLGEYEKQEMLFPDYAQLISDMFFSNRPVENWYFSQEGLCFFFNPYEIGPSSSGTLLATVAYDTLGGLLKDGYFPNEAVSFNGAPKVEDFDSANTGDISNFAELILDEKGKQVLLYAQGTMLNVRIETGSWSKDTGISFYPDATVFAATAISKGDAVMIQCSDLSALRLSYESQGQVYQVSLPRS